MLGRPPQDLLEGLYLRDEWSWPPTHDGTTTPYTLEYRGTLQSSSFPAFPSYQLASAILAANTTFWAKDLPEASCVMVL